MSSSANLGVQTNRIRPPTLQSEWMTCSNVSGLDSELVVPALLNAHPCWAGLPMAVHSLPGNAEVFDLTNSRPTLAVARAGRGTRRYSSGHFVRDLYSSPAMFEMYGEGAYLDHARWQGVSGEVVSIQFPTELVNRLLHAEGRGFRLPTVFEQFDARVSDLVMLLWTEAHEGGPRGRLYTEGISLALLGLLLDSHGACQHADVRPQARLSPIERTVVRDYIEQHFSRDLSVERLAATVQMSASHFSRAFKATFGASPHVYVTERRIAAAQLLLRADRQQSLAELSSHLGFSSQSHFTETFRRKIGVTPGRWRSG